MYRVSQNSYLKFYDIYQLIVHALWKTVYVQGFLKSLPKIVLYLSADRTCIMEHPVCTGCRLILDQSAVIIDMNREYYILVENIHQEIL